MKKISTLILILLLLTGCKSNEQDKQTEYTTSDTTTEIATEVEKTTEEITTEEEATEEITTEKEIIIEKGSKEDPYEIGDTATIEFVNVWTNATGTANVTFNSLEENECGHINVTVSIINCSTEEEFSLNDCVFGKIGNETKGVIDNVFFTIGERTNYWSAYMYNGTTNDYNLYYDIEEVKSKKAYYFMIQAYCPNDFDSQSYSNKTKIIWFKLPINE